MYNRYIPQSDGSYSRKSMGNQQPPPKQERTNPVKAFIPPAPSAANSPDPPVKKEASPGIGNFLKQLLPKEFDTGDLLIVLLLLLMAGDCEEEKHNALMTLALYFIL